MNNEPYIIPNNLVFTITTTQNLQSKYLQS